MPAQKCFQKGLREGALIDLCLRFRDLERLSEPNIDLPSAWVVRFGIKQGAAFNAWWILIEDIHRANRQVSAGPDSSRESVYRISTVV